MRRGRIGRLDLGRAALQAVHLAADVGALAGVERDQCSELRIAGAVCISGDQARGQVGAAMVLEVHRQEGDVGGHVAMAEGRVELDTVDDDEVVGHRVDVLGVQIAVAVADAAVRLAAAEPRVERAQTGVTPALDDRVVGGADGIAVQRADLGEVLVHQSRDHVRIAAVRDGGAGGGARVERHQTVGDAVDERRVDRPLGEQTRQHPVRGQAAHVHGVLDRPGGVGRSEREAAVARDDGQDAAIDVAGESAVEPHLLVAEVTPPLERGEIEEGEADRFLQLVDVIAGEEHVGDVRLDQLDAVGRRRIEARHQHRADDWGQPGHNGRAGPASSSL